jgi:TetR/AcrR family acrAB operon transcriptional repressor
MVRRTKDDAQATRQPIAGCCRARVCRKRRFPHLAQRHCPGCRGQPGAIYWHFKNKADLFNAMLERITLPMEAAFLEMGREADPDPVAELRCATLTALRQIATDARIRRVFEVATHKVEYVDEQLAIKERHLRAYTNCVQATQRSLQDAAQRSGVPLPVPADVASNGLHALMSGLIQAWLMDPQAFDLVDTAEQAVTTYLKGLGLTVQPVSSR